MRDTQGGSTPAICDGCTTHGCPRGADDVELCEVTAEVFQMARDDLDRALRGDEEADARLHDVAVKTWERRE